MRVCLGVCLSAYFLGDGIGSTVLKLSGSNGLTLSKEEWICFCSVARLQMIINILDSVFRCVHKSGSKENIEVKFRMVQINHLILFLAS